MRGHVHAWALVLLVSRHPCLAQTAPAAAANDFRPASSNQPGREYPQVNSEGRVRVRLVAPDAQSVLLDIGAVRYPLTRGADGAWIGDSAPQDEGFHYYQLWVDSAKVPYPDTGAVIASHTVLGEIALKEMDILEADGLDLDRFIWVHANAEVDQSYHSRAASRGAYLEFDAIGQKGASQSDVLDFTLAVIGAGYADRILLSHDAGWYDPSQPDGKPVGEGIRGFTALVDESIPALRMRGLSDGTIRQLTVTNPAAAFVLKV